MSTTQNADIKGFDDKPEKPFKLPKGVIITVAIFVVLILAAMIAPSFLDQAKYKDMIVQKVEESTGYTVSWAGDLGISVLPVPHVTIHDATVSAGTQKILTIKEASVSVELLPLLQKKIEISSIDLTEPDISLVVDAAGRQTWMTDKLTQQKETSAPSAAKSEQPKQNQDISFGSIKIDNGHIIYKDLSKKTSQEISKLDTDISADSLSGPFKVKSQFYYNGNEIALKGTVGAIETGKATTTDFGIILPKLNVDGSYKGEFTTGDQLSLKGDLRLSADDIEKTISTFSKSDTKLPNGLNGKFDLATSIVYDGDNASLEKLALAIGGLSYEGNLKVSGLKTSPSPKLTVDLASSRKAKAGDNLIMALSDLSVKGAGTFVNNVVTIEQGTILFQGQTINLAGSYALPGKTGGRPRVNATIKADRIDVDALNKNMTAANEKTDQKASSDSDTPAKQAASQIKGVSLPFDGTVAGAIGNLIVGGKTYSNLNFNLLSNGNALTINTLSLNAVADTSITAKGSIADTSKLSDFNINTNIQTANVEALAKAYNIPLTLQQSVGAASVNGNFRGSLDNLSFNATANALGFAVTGIGSVKSVMDTPKIETLNLRVRHTSLQSAVRNFSPAFTAPGSFNGPLDVSTTVALDEKKYTLSNIAGTIGSTTVGGNLIADMTGAKPAISGDLNFGNMVFDSPAPKAGTTTASAQPASAPVASSESRWSHDPIDTSWMNKFNASLKIKAASITQGLWKLTNANLSFDLKDGYLGINNMDAKVFGGDIAISGNMKGGDAKAPLSMNWTAKATTINAQQMLSALQNKQTDTLSGTIKSFDTNISTSGTSPAALVNALSGKGSASGSDLLVKGVDAPKLADAAKGSYKPLERAGSLFNSFKDGQTAFSTFDMAYTIANGIVTFSEIKLDGDQATINGTGNVNLPAWTVSLKNTMTVKNSEVPPFDFTISGPLDNPLQAGSGAIESFLRQKVQAQVGSFIQDKLGKKLGLPAGILGGNTTTTTPVTSDIPATTTPGSGTTSSAPLTKQEKKQQQIEQGVKALQGLFGK